MQVKERDTYLSCEEILARNVNRCLKTEMNLRKELQYEEEPYLSALRKIADTEYEMTAIIYRFILAASQEVLTTRHQYTADSESPDEDPSSLEQALDQLMAANVTLLDDLKMAAEASVGGRVTDSIDSLVNEVNLYCRKISMISLTLHDV